MEQTGSASTEVGSQRKVMPHYVKRSKRGWVPHPLAKCYRQAAYPHVLQILREGARPLRAFSLPGWGTHAYQECYYNLDSEQSKGSKEEPTKEVPVKASPAKRPKYQEESSVTAVDVSEEEKNKPKKKEESPERKEKEKKPEKKKDDKEKKDDRKEKRQERKEAIVEQAKERKEREKGKEREERRKSRVVPPRPRGRKRSLTDPSCQRKLKTGTPPVYKPGCMKRAEAKWLGQYSQHHEHYDVQKREREKFVHKFPLRSRK